MSKTILLTGATDGIGFETAKLFASQGHSLLIHGRNPDKLARTEAALKPLMGEGAVLESYKADLAKFDDVENFADAVLANHKHLDVLLNNAGVFKTSHTRTADGLDTRFMVNTIAPYILTQKLLPIMPKDGRVVNLSSAAQAPVDEAALKGVTPLDHMGAYAQSKLAITMWTRAMAENHPDGPLFAAINPGSYLASKMVKEGFGMAGNDLSIGADILVRASLSDEFEGRSGEYFNNDAGRFGPPHPEAMDGAKVTSVVAAVEDVIAKFMV